MKLLGRVYFMRSEKLDVFFLYKTRKTVRSRSEIEQSPLFGFKKPCFVITVTIENNSLVL